MSATTRRAALGGVAVLGVLTAVLAGENPARNAGRLADKAARPAAAGVITPQENDRRIARWLAIDNRMLIEFSQMAEDRAGGEGVKQLARMIVAEHQRLQDALDDRPEGGRKSSDRVPPASRTATLIEDEGRSRDGAAFFRPTDFLDVKEEVCDSLRSNAKKEFGTLNGADFDEAYLAHIVFAHEGMLATIDAVDGNATDNLKATLKDARNATEKHLRQARDLRRGDRRATGVEKK